MLKIALYLRPAIHRIRCGAEPDYDESLAHLRIEDPDDEDEDDLIASETEADDNSEERG